MQTAEEGPSPPLKWVATSLEPGQSLQTVCESMALSSNGCTPAPGPHRLCREPYAPMPHSHLHGGYPLPSSGHTATHKGQLCNQLDRSSDLLTSAPTVTSPFKTDGCMELACGGYLENIVLGSRRYATEPYRMSRISGHFSKIKKYSQLPQHIEISTEVCANLPYNQQCMNAPQGIF